MVCLLHPLDIRETRKILRTSKNISAKFHKEMCKKWDILTLHFPIKLKEIVVSFFTINAVDFLRATYLSKTALST